MPDQALSQGGRRLDDIESWPRLLRAYTVLTVYALFLWSSLAAGAYSGWPLCVTQLLALAGLLCWGLGMVGAGRFEHRQTALDFPLVLLVALVLLQLAVGNRAFATWALAPPPSDPAAAVTLPTPLLILGSIFPSQTLESLLLFLTYVVVYVLVVNVIRRRSDLDRLVRVLILAGGVLAYIGLVEYLGGHTWLVWWREEERVTRLLGTFVNPDHFATWLGMLICLGIGYLKGRTLEGKARPLMDVLRRRGAREEAIRRYLPFAAVAVMSLALVFTLSRGGLLALAMTFVALFFLFGQLGQMRWWLVLLGALTVVALGYGAWIGLDPVLARVDPRADWRWAQWRTTLPMVKDFPVLGVGLGAYKDIYPRYQPAELLPADYYFPYAHSDLLQLVVELGPIGAALAVFAFWRVAGDLIGAHLLGWRHCPVANPRAGRGKRDDPFSVGIGIGALAAVSVLLLHSAVDFSARIPANGILAAACAGIAMVALHSSFGDERARFLAATYRRSLGSGRGVRIFAGAAITLVVLAGSAVVLEPMLVETVLNARRGRGGLAALNLILAMDRGNLRALRDRAELRRTTAEDLMKPAGPAGTTSGTAAEAVSEAARTERARYLIAGAILDWRQALALSPSRAALHVRLALGYQTAARLDPAHASAHQLAGVAHLRRAIALAPEDPTKYVALAVLAAAEPGRWREVALAAAAAAVVRDPTRLPGLVDVLLPLGLSDTQWAALVPAVTADRLRLASVLEASERVGEAERMYRQARDVALPEDEAVARWFLARLLARKGEPGTAVAELDVALRREPDNPELHFVRARALEALNDPGALEAYRVALRTAAARAKGDERRVVFATREPRVRALIGGILNDGGTVSARRYRWALARYLVGHGLWEEAAAESERIAARVPDDEEAHFFVGRALEGLGLTGRAIEAYQKAAAIEGSPASYRFQLARMLWATERYYEAMEQWRAVIARDPKNVEAHLELGHAYLKAGERVEALREYEQVLALAPDHPGPRQALARMGRR